MKKNRKIYLVIITTLCMFILFFGWYKTKQNDPSVQKEISLEEHLKKTDEEWFLTGKKEYQVKAMMVSKETSFHNEYEDVDYTVTDDGETVILKGVVGEMWATKLAKVIDTYTKPDGSQINASEFEQKDVYIDLLTKAAPDSNYAMFVPADTIVIVETAWGDELHTNVLNVPHGDGDYLVCRKGEDGKPDLSDVWVLNGVIFQKTYDISNKSK